MRINQEKRQYLSVPWFRRVFELERSDPVLKDIRESKESSLSGHDSADFLHFGPILFDAVEFFNTLIVILLQLATTTRNEA